ncbi:hypothetical protein ACFE04_024156 [Oxalis oulophora]
MKLVTFYISPHSNSKCSKIQATIKGLLLHKFGSIIKEGECYVISNFRLARNFGWTRVSNNKFKLNFTLLSKIEEILATTLAEYRYHFVRFGAVGGRETKNCHLLIDVSHVMKGVSSGRSTMTIKIVLKNENLNLARTLTSQRLSQLLEPSLDVVFSNPSQLNSIQYVKEFKEEGRFIIYGTVEIINEQKEIVL